MIWMTVHLKCEDVNLWVCEFGTFLTFSVMSTLTPGLTRLETGIWSTYHTEAPVSSEFLSLLRISEFFGFQWQNLTEILRLLPKVLQSENEAVIMITSPLYNICLQQMWLFESLLKSRGLSFGAGLKKLLLCLIFIGQGLAWKWFTRFFCRESVNAAITRFFCRECHIYAFFFVANVVITRFLG